MFKAQHSTKAAGSSFLWTSWGIRSRNPSHVCCAHPSVLMCCSLLCCPADCEKLPPPVLPFQNVSFSYSGNEEGMLYKDLEFGIDCDSRIALVGPNGAGGLGRTCRLRGRQLVLAPLGPVCAMDATCGLNNALCIRVPACQHLCMQQRCSCQFSTHGKCSDWCLSCCATAGKSTLLKLMLGDLEPTRGTVTRHT